MSPTQLGLPCRAIPSLLRVAANNKVDSGKLSPFMKQYLRASVASGELVQTKSKGASRSFKLAATKLEEVMACTIPVQRH
jgi:hypothetical protein